MGTVPLAVPLLAGLQGLGSSPRGSPPEDPSLAQLPSLPPPSCPRLPAPFPPALPGSGPTPPLLPAPILLGRASPVAAAARSAASAGRSRAARAMAGSDESSTPRLGHWRAGSALRAPPRCPTGCAASSLAGRRLSLDKRPSLSSTRPASAASLWGEALSLAASPARLLDALSSLAEVRGLPWLSIRTGAQRAGAGGSWWQRKDRSLHRLGSNTPSEAYSLSNVSPLYLSVPALLL